MNSLLTLTLEFKIIFIFRCTLVNPESDMIPLPLRFEQSRQCNSHHHPILKNQNETYLEHGSSFAFQIMNVDKTKQLFWRTISQVPRAGCKIMLTADTGSLKMKMRIQKQKLELARKIMKIIEVKKIIEIKEIKKFKGEFHTWNLYGTGETEMMAWFGEGSDRNLQIIVYKKHQ